MQLPEWRVTNDGNAALVQWCVQVSGRGGEYCTNYLLTQHWVNHKV